MSERETLTAFRRWRTAAHFVRSVRARAASVLDWLAERVAPGAWHD